MEKTGFVDRIFGTMAPGILLLSVIFAAPAWGQSLNWASQAGGVGGVTQGFGIAADSAGNSYVTGFFRGIVTFGPGETNEAVLTSMSFDYGSIFVAKYAGDGGLLWARKIDATAGGAGYAIAVDGEGNSYVTGLFLGVATFGYGETSQTVLSCSGNSDIFVAKFAADGRLLWARSDGGPEFEYAYGIALDGSGDSYVTGGFGGTATFGYGEAGETVLTSFGSTDIFVAKYAGDGRLLWAKPAGSSGYEFGEAIAADGAGNAYVTGGFSGTATFSPGGAGETALTSLGGNDIFVAKLAGDGRLLWVRPAGGVDYSSGRGIALDGAGNSYVTGFFTGTATFGFGEANETSLTCATGVQEADIFVAKYAGNGSLLWARQAGGPGDDFGEGIAVDEAGNGQVTGSFSGSARFGPGENNESVLTTLSYAEIFVASYAGDGRLLWARQASGSGEAEGNAIALDGAGNSYVVGGFFGTVIFGAGEAGETSLTSFGDTDTFVARYAEDTVEDLINMIEGFNLNQGIASSLTAKLRGAQEAIETANPSQRENAAHILEAFINAVEAQRGKNLTEEQADQLVAVARQMLAEL
jgi:Beta-propeller repeat